MTTTDVLYTITVLLSVGAMALSIYNLHTKLQAERQFREIVKGQTWDNIEKLQEARALLLVRSPSDAAVAGAKELIAPALTLLSDKIREQVECGLSQPSTKGKANYLAKLLLWMISGDPPKGRSLNRI